jgi:CDP-6-deoxy-D-xylo-4-hexulose-3-dehydrase
MIPLMRYAFLNETETRKALADFILQAPILSMSQKCLEFEEKFGLFQGRKEAILFNSGGSANLALLQALKNLGRLKHGMKVGFSALTWSTNTMPIIQMGLEPIALDCEIQTLNVSSRTILQRLEEVDLEAIFLTNVLGFVDDIVKIKEICSERNIILIEDNCESLGTKIENELTGNFGLASSFSFFVAHHMSTIEGGMICTDDEELAMMLRIVRANGWDRNLNSDQQILLRKEYEVKSEFDAKYTFYDLGFNFRPTEITGFLGLNQMKYLEENIKIREANFLRVEKIILKNEDILPLKHNHISILSTFALPIICKTPGLRNNYLNKFTKSGIEIRPMIAGNMQKQPFYSKYVQKFYNLPNTDFLHECSFYSGNFPELTEIDLHTIENCLL